MRHSPRTVAAAAVFVVSALLLAGCTAAFAETAGTVAQRLQPRPVPSATATPIAIPTVEAASPASGSLSGGDTVTLTGSSLSQVTAVMFGEQAATDLTVVDENTITVVAPRHATYQSGSVAITAKSGEQTVPATGDLSYEYTAVSDVDRQMQYALAYWKDYNDDEWGNYNPLGGDCANFVSQTLAARGWEQTATWRNSAGSATSAWSFVPALDNWLQTVPDVTRLSSEQRDQVAVGDVAVFSWSGTGYRDHVMIVSDVIANDDGSIDIKLVGHNVDYDFRDLDETLTEEHPGGDVWFYSIP
ncbi:amidase domain-containing protein [Paramicrobacterium agarici]|uniref:IPT/TIG domain-containing protein n=1 Tax=Paramicrobacterium agarici TaxID=630514 RepID=A0A2A9DRT9_9MICO|nr:amidase domain-containing protein [Microbacterium agarici]PFG29304.1 IPT/TIG domain-containing protein [Microbacterium agarici]